MRILMLSWEYPPNIVGGLSRHLAGLCPSLAKMGVEVHLITSNTGDLPTYEEKDGVHIHRVYADFIDPLDFPNRIHQLNFATVQAAIPLLNTKKFQLIHVHDWLNCMAGRVLKHAYKIPLVATIHATEFGRRGGINEPLSRYIHAQEWLLGYEAWRVIVCSMAMKNEVINVLSIPPDKIEVIPNGIDTERFDIEVEEGFRERFVAPDEKLILFVGRLVWEKGIDVLIDCSPYVLERFPKAKFIVVGKGNIEEYRQRARNLGVESKFFFTGFLDDETVAKLYKCADICVYPSRYEPFGIVALEAMAVGIPPITSDAGGFLETVRNGETGLITRKGDPLLLAQAIVFLLDNPSLKEKMGKQAEKEARERYRWEMGAQRTIQLYRRVVKERKESQW
ncbi:glycosyltransferase family 4 protein [bacterium]|nr:glycosyltransferase family 4 protein [bacterium]